MYDITTKNIKKGQTSFYILFLVGIFLLIAVGWIYISSIIKLKNIDSSVTSTNVEIKTHIDNDNSTMYSPVYYYTVDGKKYTCTSNYSSNINPGSTNKTIYYDSKNPSNCTTEFFKSGNNIILLFLLMIIIFIKIAIVNIKKMNKRIKKILELNQKGKLVKNLSYRLENSGIVINGTPIKKTVVDYTLPSGVNITLYGDARYDRKNRDLDNMVDLLMDESNPDNYFIDFEINRISGNLPQDYYQQKTSSVINSNQNIKNEVDNNPNTNF